MLNARKVLLENFDEEVQERLKVAQTDAKASLDRLERLLMRFTRAMLDGHATFDGDGLAFTLKSAPVPFAAPADIDAEAVLDVFPLGRYELPRRSDEAHVYRLQHPLAQSLLKSALRAPLAPSRLHLDYAAYGSKVSVLDALRGGEGVCAVQLLRVQSLGVTEEYLLAAGVASGQILDADVTERLLSLPGRADALPRADMSSALQGHGPQCSITLTDQPGLDFAAAHAALPKEVQAELARQRASVIGRVEQRNLVLFSDETEKLDAWADDLKVGLEREIKELDRRIKETRAKGKGAATLAEKLAAQKEQREMERLRDTKRRDLFVRQDEIQAKRDRLIDELEQQLNQQVADQTLLCCEWRMS